MGGTFLTGIYFMGPESRVQQPQLSDDMDPFI